MAPWPPLWLGAEVFHCFTLGQLQIQRAHLSKIYFLSGVQFRPRLCNRECDIYIKLRVYSLCLLCVTSSQCSVVFVVN